MSAASLKDLTIYDLNLHTTKPLAFSIAPETPLRDALAVMKDRNILAVPLQSRSNPVKITSLVNVFDILIYGSNQLLAGKPLDLSRPAEEALSLIDTQRESYLMTIFDYRDTVNTVMDIFRTGTHHRALVSDALNKLPQIIMTQSDIIRYIHAHPETQVECDRSSTLSSLNLVPDHRPVHTISISDTPLAGFKMMKEKNCLALPIVDSENNILGTLSASDLRGLTELDFADFIQQPLSELIEKRGKPQSIICTGNDTLQDTIGKIVKHHIHRVWVVDDGMKVVGVVSLSDIIGVLAGKR